MTARRVPTRAPCQSRAPKGDRHWLAGRACQFSPFCTLLNGYPLPENLFAVSSDRLRSVPTHHVLLAQLPDKILNSCLQISPVPLVSVSLLCTEEATPPCHLWSGIGSPLCWGCHTIDDDHQDSRTRSRRIRSLNSHHIVCQHPILPIAPYPWP